jgi:hypothetical protein
MVNVSRPVIALCPNERVSNASPGAPVSFKQRMTIMRDFRDAKAMARALRASLAAKGIKITISQSLELIAEVFGVADWNTLAAAIRRKTTRDENAPASPEPFRRSETTPLFSRALELTLHRTLAYANQRSHEHATLEHLLLALTDDGDACAVMNACKVDIAALKAHLTNYIDNELKTLMTDDDRDSRPTAAFQRVVRNAVLHVQGMNGDTVTGGDVLMAMFEETESHAVWLLGEKAMTQQDAANFIQGVVRKSFSHGRTKPVVVEKAKRRTAAPTDGKTVKSTRPAPPDIAQGVWAARSISTRPGE